MAFYSIDNESGAILQIQRILRDIAFLGGYPSAVGLSGVYDQNTREAVGNFQRKYGIADTGIVDKETWDLMILIDKISKEKNQPSEPVYILPRQRREPILPGENNSAIYVIQHMLNVLSSEYDDFQVLELNGIYDSDTENNIRAFKRRALLFDTPDIDIETYNMLSREYERVNEKND